MIGLADRSGVVDTVDRNVHAFARDLAKYCDELLELVQAQRWFNAPEPDEVLEREIWRSRAALLDAFVRQQRHFPDV